MRVWIRPLLKGHGKSGLALMAVLMSMAAFAADEADRAAGRSIITRQIEAFRTDDAAEAYAFASPGIQGMFGSADTFLDMVRRAYPPVHRPRSFAFGEARDLDDGFEQHVQIQDEAGADWDAVYTFERQPDGFWRISGCRLIKRPGEAV